MTRLNSSVCSMYPATNALGDPRAASALTSGVLLPDPPLRVQVSFNLGSHRTPRRHVPFRFLSVLSFLSTGLLQASCLPHGSHLADKDGRVLEPKRKCDVPQMQLPHVEDGLAREPRTGKVGNGQAKRGSRNLGDMQKLRENQVSRETDGKR